VATSPAFVGRLISRANESDRASLGHFLKKPSHFIEINLQSTPSLSFFPKKNLELYRNKPAVQAFEWAGLPPAQWVLMGRIRPGDVFPYLLIFFFYE
jgi:hypothetical protein